MESKVDLSALQKQLEYYLSDKNLKQDEFFYNKLKESQDVNTLSNFLKILAFHSSWPLPQLQ